MERRPPAARRLQALQTHLPGPRRRLPPSTADAASPQLSGEGCAGGAAGGVGTRGLLLAAAALYGCGYLLGYRAGRRAAWAQALLGAGPGEDGGAGPQRGVGPPDQQDKASRWTKTGQQLNAARVGQRRTEKPRRRVEMVDFPGTPPRRRPKGLRTMYDDESDDDDDPDVS